MHTRTFLTILLFLLVYCSAPAGAVPVIVDGIPGPSLLSPSDREVLSNQGFFPANVQEVPPLVAGQPLIQKLVDDLLVHEKNKIPRAVIIADSLIPDALLIPPELGGPLVVLTLGWLAATKTGDQLATSVAHETKHLNSKIQEKVNQTRTGNFFERIRGRFLKRTVENEVDFAGVIDLANRAGRSPYALFEVFNTLYAMYGDVGGTSHTTLSSRADSLGVLLAASKRKYGVRLVEHSDPADPINPILQSIRTLTESQAFRTRRLGRAWEFVDKEAMKYLEGALPKLGEIKLAEEYSFDNYAFAVQSKVEGAATELWDRMLALAGGDLSARQLESLHYHYTETVEREYKKLLQKRLSETGHSIQENVGLLTVSCPEQLPDSLTIERRLEHSQEELTDLQTKLASSDLNPETAPRIRARASHLKLILENSKQLLPLAQIWDQRFSQKYRMNKQEWQASISEYLKDKVLDLFTGSYSDQTKVRSYLFASYGNLFKKSGVPSAVLKNYIATVKSDLDSKSRETRAKAAESVFKDWFPHHAAEGDYPSLADFFAKHEKEIPNASAEVAALLAKAYRTSPKALHLYIDSQGDLRPVSEGGETSFRLFEQSKIGEDALRNTFRRVQRMQRRKTEANTVFVPHQAKELITLADALLAHAVNPKARSAVAGLKKRVRTWAVDQGPAEFIKEAAPASRISFHDAKLLMELSDPYWMDKAHAEKHLTAVTKQGKVLSLGSRRAHIPIGNLSGLLHWNEPDRLNQEMRSLGRVIQMSPSRNEPAGTYSDLCLKLLKPIEWLLKQGPSERVTAFSLLNQVKLSSNERAYHPSAVMDSIEGKYHSLLVTELSRDLQAERDPSVAQRAEALTTRQLRPDDWAESEFYLALKGSFLLKGTPALKLKNWVELSHFASQYDWKRTEILRTMENGKYRGDATPETLSSWFRAEEATDLLLDPKKAKSIPPALKVQALARLLSYKKNNYGSAVEPDDIETIFDSVWRETEKHPELRAPLENPKFVGALAYSSSQSKLALWQLERTFHLSEKETQLKNLAAPPPAASQVRAEISAILGKVVEQFPEKGDTRQIVLETVARKTMANAAELARIEDLKINIDNFSSIKELVYADVLQNRLHGLRDPAAYFSIIKYLIGKEKSIPEPILNEIQLSAKVCPGIKRRFQDSDLFFRSYLLTTLLDSSSGALASKEVERLVTETLLGEWAKDKVIAAVVEDYLSSVHLSEKEFLIARVLSSLADSKDGKVPIARVFEAMGTLGIKFAQFLRRSGLLSPELNKELENIFDHALEPDRIEVVREANLAFAAHPKTLLGVLEVMNSGSLGTAVHLRVQDPESGGPISVAARVLKPNADNHIAAENETWEKVEKKLLARKAPPFSRAAYLIGEMRKHSMKTLGPEGPQVHYLAEWALGKKAAKVYDSPRDPKTGYLTRALKPLEEVMKLVDPNMHDRFLVYEKIDHIPLRTINPPALREGIAVRVVKTEAHAAHLGKLCPDNNPGNWLINPEKKELVRIDYPEFTELTRPEVEAADAFFRTMIRGTPDAEIIQALNKHGAFLFSVKSAAPFSWEEALPDFRGMPPAAAIHDRVMWIRGALQTYLMSRDPSALVEITDNFRTQLASLSGLPIWGESIRPHVMLDTLVHEFIEPPLAWRVKQAVLGPVVDFCRGLFKQAQSRQK